MIESPMECYYTGIAGIRGLEPDLPGQRSGRIFRMGSADEMQLRQCPGSGCSEVDTAGADGARAKTIPVKRMVPGRTVSGTVAGGVTVSVVIPAGMEAELDLTALGLDVREHLIPGRYRFLAPVNIRVHRCYPYL